MSVLPVAAWAGALTGGAVLAATGTAGAVLAAQGALPGRAVLALGLGTLAGLAVACVAVAAAGRVGAGLRALRVDAVNRLARPDAPVERERPVAARASAELAELADVLDALHARLRLADQLSAQHRREVQTAGAGVFELLSGLVAAEEGARGQLAAELHDTVAQSLVVARTLLADAQHAAVLQQGPVDPASLRLLSDYVTDAEEQVRAVMARTRPPALHDGDLAAAVSGLQADMANRYGLEVTVDWPTAPHALPSAIALVLYRFFQEALLNVVKHADVDEAALSLHVDGEQVTAVVRDEGPGFDPAAVRSTGGRSVGLGLLRERARLAGGLVEVESQPSLGTTLRLSLRLPPLPAPERSLSAAAG